MKQYHEALFLSYRLRTDHNFAIQIALIQYSGRSKDAWAFTETVKKISKITYTVCCPVSGWYQYPDTLNKNSIFEAPFSVPGRNEVFRMKAEHFRFKIDESFGEFKVCSTVAEVVCLCDFVHEIHH